MALSVLITVSASDNQNVLDATDRAYGMSFGTNEHGFSFCEFVYPISRNEAFSIYDRMGASYIRVSDNGTIVWEGRVEDVAIIDVGLRIKALGFQRAMYDAPYTALWSDASIDGWRPILTTDVSTHNPDMYEMDKQNRLFIGLKKDASYASGNDAGGWYYIIPDESSTQVEYVSGSYAFNLPAGWVVQAIAWNAGFASAITSNISTSGGSGTGSFTWDISGSPRDIAAFRCYNSAGSTTTYTSESGDNYFRMTSVRVRATSSAGVGAAEISAALVTYVSGINSSQILLSSTLIDDAGIDLSNEVYEDQYPGDILNRFSEIGDTSGNVWEWGVYEDRRLHFRVRGSAGRAWYVDVDALSVEKTINTLYNSVYAVYSEADGRAVRTATSASNYSADRYGVVRRRAVPINTTGSATADYTRDTALTDGADPSPRIALLFREVYGADGARWKLWNVRSGDTITVRNLHPTISVDIDRIRTFRVSETTYRVDDDVLEVIPETPPPMLDVLVARRSAGVSSAR